MRCFETTHLVTSEDLNHHNTLLASRGSAWFIEAGYIAGAGELNAVEGLVLRSVNQLNYLCPARIGELITYHSKVVYAGTTSLIVSVTAENMLTGKITMTGFATFVSINEATSKKQPHKIVLDITEDQAELCLREQALAFAQR